MLSDSAILKHIARQSKRQAGYKQLVRELGLHGEERRQLNDHLHKLVKSGALIPVDSDRYALPQAAADKNLVAGRLTMHRDGFGFVIPDAKSLCACSEIQTRRRHLHPAAPDRQRHARRPGAGRYPKCAHQTGAPKVVSCGPSIARTRPSLAPSTTVREETMSRLSTQRSRRKS